MDAGERSTAAAATMLEQVRAGGLLGTGQPLIVMYSGGRDSSCLLDLAILIAGSERVQALHVNYRLRETADRDEAHCAAVCGRHGIALEVRRPAAAPSGNVQAWARAERYAAARELAAALPDALIATGYTATDQVETVLYRLISSPSRRALVGAAAQTGDLIRPLLPFTRDQTREYCVERGLEWVDDETNDTDKYVRNRIRHELLPLLNDLHPGAERNLLELAATLRDEQQVLDGLVDAEIASDGVQLARLRELPTGLARLVVQRLADAVHGEPAPGTARRLAEILALSDTGIAHLDLPHRVRVTARSGRLSFAQTDAKPRDRGSDRDGRRQADG